MSGITANLNTQTGQSSGLAEPQLPYTTTPINPLLFADHGWS